MRRNARTVLPRLLEEGIHLLESLFSAVVKFRSWVNGHGNAPAGKVQGRMIHFCGVNVKNSDTMSPTSDRCVGCQANEESNGLQYADKDSPRRSGQMGKIDETCPIYYLPYISPNRPQWVWGPIFSTSLFALPAGLLFVFHRHHVSVKAHSQVYREYPQPSIRTLIHILVAVLEDYTELCHSFLLPFFLPSLLCTRHPPIVSVYRRRYMGLAHLPNRCPWTSQFHRLSPVYWTSWELQPRAMRCRSRRSQSLCPFFHCRPA